MLIPKQESDRVEFKASFSDGVIISLIAFSNTKEGAVYIGDEIKYTYIIN